MPEELPNELSRCKKGFDLCARFASCKTGYVETPRHDLAAKDEFVDNNF